MTHAKRDAGVISLLAGVLPGVVGLVVVVLAWQLVAVHDPYVIPSVPALFDQLIENPGLYWSNLVVTLKEMGVGLAISFVVAFGLSILMCHLRFIERAVTPLAIAINVTPIVAIAPGLAIGFGFGEAPKYIVTALVVFYPLLVNCLSGLRNVDRDALEVFESVRASKKEVLWRLRLPSSVPWIFAGLRIALPLSVVGAVVAEFLVSGTAGGLGSLIEVAQSNGSLAQIYAPTVLLALTGITLTLLVVLGERLVLSRREVTR